ncbi:MAG: peptide ABC transporter substrate-binding protein, partial [Deltaproteobacteria bacterium]|nr:peptide ABC transporter substrate-binding protein [Deltaproteobacteria bacterium]
MTKQFFLILLCSILILGCTTNDQYSEDIDQKNTININIGNEPPTLDWSLAMDSTSYTVLNNLMEGLTKFDDSLIPQPALAKSWEISEDGTTYTFNI